MIHPLGGATCSCGWHFREWAKDALVRCGYRKCRRWLRITPAGSGLVRVQVLTTEQYLEIRDDYRREAA
jgi:hypothetical protein